MVVFFYTLISLLVDFGIKIIKGTSFQSLNYTFYFGFTIIEYILATFFIFQLLKNPIVKKIIQISSFAFIIASIFFYMSNKSEDLLASIECILIIMFCLAYFFDQISAIDTDFVYNKAEFWIVMAFMIYLSGTLFLFILSATLPKGGMKYWYINNIFNIIKNLLFAIAFFMKKETTNNLTMQNRYNI